MGQGLRATLGGIAAGVLAAAALAGCGSGPVVRSGAPTAAGGELKPIPVASAGLLRKNAPGTLARHALPGAGTTQHVDASGAGLAVTLLRVIDPLRGSGATLPPQTRAVGVLVQIRSFGPDVYDSSATGDISLISSAGPATPVLATRGICRTPQNDFDRYMTAGEDRTGCVAFVVADSATLDAVRFSPHAHQLGRLTWAP